MSSGWFALDGTSRGNKDSNCNNLIVETALSCHYWDRRLETPHTLGWASIAQLPADRASHNLQRANHQGDWTNFFMTCLKTKRIVVNIVHFGQVRLSWIWGSLCFSFSYLVWTLQGCVPDFVLIILFLKP